MKTAMQRFNSKVDVQGSPALKCWLWLGAKDYKGYGRFRVSSTPSLFMQAHRWLFQELRHSLSKEDTLDHLCPNKHCVNPNHLRVATIRDNILSGNGPAAQNARKTHCKNGHLYNNENTHIRKSGKRMCRACGRIPFRVR